MPQGKKKGARPPPPGKEGSKGKQVAKGKSGSAGGGAPMHPPQPSKWPADCTYITDNIWSSDIPKEVVAKYKKDGRRQPPPGKPGGNKLVQFMRITDPSHPACGQNGLFAAKSIPGGGHVLDYVGLATLEASESRESDYTLRLGEVTIDADRYGNEARMVNDFRNTGQKQNASTNGDVRMAVWAGPRGIRRGDEILVSYGKGYWAARGLLPTAGDFWGGEWEGGGGDGSE